MGKGTRKGTAFVDLCIREKFFTNGDKKQYQECIEFADNLGEMRERYSRYIGLFESLIMQLAAMTYICSDLETVSFLDVAEKVKAIYEED